MLEIWEKNKYTIRDFTDLSKAFVNVEHHTFLRKLEHSDIKGKKIKQFKRYLSVQMKCIQISNFENTACKVF